MAIDSFKNKAKCNFTILVVDKTPPAIENCINPPIFYIPDCSQMIDKSLCFIEWEDPIIYDNSNVDLFVNQTIEPGYLNVGRHNVKYVAVDYVGNANTCTMQIQVETLKCDVLASPANGTSICAKNMTHTWCEVSCNFGYAIYDELEELNLENFKLFCENNFPKWKYELIPDCTVMELPNSVEQIFSISLDSDASVCNDTSATDSVNFFLNLINNSFVLFTFFLSFF